LDKVAIPMVLDDPTDGSYEKISTGLQAETVTADVVVQDFMTLAEGSAFEESRLLLQKSRASHLRT
jgi:hypothetical protein